MRLEGGQGERGGEGGSGERRADMKPGECDGLRAADERFGLSDGS